MRAWWEGRADRPDSVVGLALSGGGIRSATFSLGLILGLARGRDALSGVDVLSTVSGGGYVGCFLRSLFLPDSARGIAPRGGASARLNRKELEYQHAFARTVLESGPDIKDIEWQTTAGRKISRRNPLWWLREHSRYLAPNGPTDYGYAIAYIARNWVAMLYIFFLASLTLLSIVGLIEAAARSFGIGWSWFQAGPEQASGLQQQGSGGSASAFRISPIAPLAALPAISTTVFAVAYWMTQAMSANEPDVRRQWRNLRRATDSIFVGSAVVIIAAFFLTPEAIPSWGKPFGTETLSSSFVWVLTAGLALAVAGAVTAFVRGWSLYSRGAALTGDLRRGFTRSLATSNRLFVIIIALALVDTLGAALAQWLRFGRDQTLGVSAMLLPALAFLIKKLPDWFGGTRDGGLFSLIGRFMNTVALIGGIALFGVFAVAADALVHLVVWDGAPWASEPGWPRIGLFLAVVWVLALLSGTANGFINLSSLHLLYSTRLTRAYLGATNNRRLEAAASDKPTAGITDNDARDYIQPAIYSRADLPAPIHVINITINETIDPTSQLVARDRKGHILSLEPPGVRVADELVEWRKIGKRGCAEQLSLGQWCAISGAAASSGMGRLTNLGLAIAFTFANVRLGYWWWSPDVCTQRRATSRSMQAFSRYFGTFVYLFNEMTARYSRGYERKYLTDGGHFENTAAYRLIERRVPLILVTDNGADPGYRFEDLENLVRKVRLDLGGELELLGGAELQEFLAGLDVQDPSIFVDPAAFTDWRDAFTARESSGFVIVLQATMGPDTLHLIWIKPRVLTGMPADLVGYASANPEFPQQPTGDQFFDEAQWESYRRLGELCMGRVLKSCPRLLA